MIQRKAFIRAALLSLATLAMAPHAGAQDKFPSRPLKIVVTFGAGGSGDLMARSLAQQLGEVLGQPVVVENRAGGSAIPGTESVAKAPADGYTILQYTNTLAVNMVLQPNLPYDLFRDFAPLAYAFEGPLVLMTPGISPHRKVSELLAYAKTKPISFGHGGVGSMGHLSGELFKRATKLDAASIAYKGNGPAMNDLLGGRLDYSAPVVKQLQDAIAKAIATPAMQERLKSVGATSANAGYGEVMTAKMKAEIARWEPVIKAANIKPD